MILSGISPYDFLISTIYVFLIILFSFFIRRKFNQGSYNKHFIPFIFFKIFCAVLFVIIHIYYYKGGDTFLFFSGGKILADQMLNDPSNIFHIFLNKEFELDAIFYSDNYYVNRVFSNSSIYFTCKVTSIFCLLGFNHFLATTILFSTFFAIGIWLLYALFCELYPNAYKVFSICILYFPTIGIWGSGILKDPITFSAIGFIFYSTYCLVKGRRFVVSIVSILISIYACFEIKPFILYIFIPTIFLWLQSRMTSGIKNPLIRYSIAPIIIALFSVGGYYFLQGVSEGAGKYSIENVESVALGFQSWHTYLVETKNQSGYTLGEVDFTFQGLLEKSPEAFYVAYYRPRPDEIRNVATALGGIEANILLLATLYVFFKIGVFRFFKVAFSDKNVRSFLFFAILFGIVLGFTSYNFGALSRYKIPSLPFFTCSIAIIYYQGLQLKRKISLKA